MARVFELRDRKSDPHATWTRGGAVPPRLDSEVVEALEAESAATIADPSAMGLWAFATGTWIFACPLAGIVPFVEAGGVIPVLASIGGIALFIAGLFAYRRADMLLATAFCAFGAFNVATAIYLSMLVAGVLLLGTPADMLQGFLFESFAFVALVLAVASIKSNLMYTAWLGTLTIGYVLAGLPFLAYSIGVGGWGTVGAIGGWFLIASSLIAYLAGAVMIVNSIWRKRTIPSLSRE